VRSRRIDQRDRRNSRHGAGRVDLDEQDLWPTPQDSHEIRGALRANGRTGGVLRSRREDRGPNPRSKRALEGIGVRAPIIDRASVKRQTERAHKVAHRRQRRIFDEHVVAGSDVFTQHTLDGIQRSVRDRHVVGWNAVCLELGARECGEWTEFERVSIQVACLAQSLEMRIQRGQKIRVGIAARQIDRAFGETNRTALTPPGRLVSRRPVMNLVRLPTDVGSPTAATNDKTANLE